MRDASDFDQFENSELMAEDGLGELPTTPQEDRSRFPWRLILIGCVGLPLLVGLICVGVTAFTGLNLLDQALEVAGVESEPAGPPLPTFVPTIDLSVLDTPTPLPGPPTETPVPEPPSGSFLNDLDGGRVDLNTPIDLLIEADDPLGLTAIQLYDNGQTIASERVSGETELETGLVWLPQSVGLHRIGLELTNAAGITFLVDEIEVLVVDPAWLESNAAVIEWVESNVAAIRGLAPTEEIYTYRMGGSALQTYLRQNAAYDEAEAIRVSTVFSLFDFVERGVNVYESSIQYTGRNILGFYDPNTNEMAIISNEPLLTPLNELTYAHELMHAIQDQYFSLDLLSADNQFGTESYWAIRALAEGEAELIEEIYLNPANGYLDEASITEVQNELFALPRNNQSAAVVGETPNFIVTTYNFPYIEGYEFAQYIFDRSGWDGINRAWANLPQSTEQILHPELYVAGDNPIPVDIKPTDGVLGPEWEVIDENVFGELYLRVMLEKNRSAADAAFAAAGWGGDRYRAFQHTETGELVLVWRLAWDSAEDSNQFASVYGPYADTEYGTNYVPAVPGATCRVTDETVCQYALGGDWLIIRAPSVELAGALIDSQR